VLSVNLTHPEHASHYSYRDGYYHSNGPAGAESGQTGGA
jgi:hypothetical protein